MAISSSVVFWVDHESGSDTARTALTSCTASNPSGTITRINKTAHGLETGAVVDLTLFSTWLNDAFRITKVDADNFDLDDTVWQATADPSGTVTPRGGNLLDPWKTLTSGATSARLANLTSVSYEVRHKKTADPVSLAQNVTLTRGSRTGTLTSAVTLTLDNCETAWTAASGVTTANNATCKQGSQATQVTTGGVFTTGLAAYKTLATDLNLSAYTGITFWMRVTNTAITAGQWQIRMYSDSARTTLVETLNIPAIASTGVWCPMYIEKGSALASQVRVIGLYATATQTNKALVIDNFSACTSTLHLKSLIGLNDGLWMPMDWLDGTTFGISNASNNLPTVGYGWPKDTTTATCYKRECYVPVDGGNSVINVFYGGGSNSSLRATYTFGWDLSTQTRTGETWFDGLTGISTGCQSGGNISYWDVAYLCTCRCGTAVHLSGLVYNIGIINCKASGNTGGSSSSSLINLSVTATTVSCTSCIVFGGATGVYLVSPSVQLYLDNCVIYNPSAYGVNVSGGTSLRMKSCTLAGGELTVPMVSSISGDDIVVISCSFSNCGTATSCTAGGRMTVLSSSFASLTRGHALTTNGCCYAINCTYTTVTSLFSPQSTSTLTSGCLYLHNTNAVANDHRVYRVPGEIFTDAITYHGSATFSWKLRPGFAYPALNVDWPLELELHRCVCVANQAQTIKAWVRRSNTGLSIGIRVKEAVLTGISTTDALCTAVADTWQEVTLTFTPTQSGVAQIWGVAWGGTTYSGYISDLTPMANQSTKLLNTAFGGQPFSSNAGETTAGASGTPAFAFLG